MRNILKLFIFLIFLPLVYFILYTINIGAYRSVLVGISVLALGISIYTGMYKSAHKIFGKTFVDIIIVLFYLIQVIVGIHLTLINYYN